MNFGKQTGSSLPKGGSRKAIAEDEIGLGCDRSSVGCSFLSKCVQGTASMTAPQLAKDKGNVAGG